MKEVTTSWSLKPDLKGVFQTGLGKQASLN